MDFLCPKLSIVVQVWPKHNKTHDLGNQPEGTPPGACWSDVCLGNGSVSRPSRSSPLAPSPL